MSKEKIIRLTASEKHNIDFRKKFLTLFYFQQTTVKVGQTYKVPTILKYGKRLDSTNTNEILPKLSFKNCFEVKCLEVKNNVAYKNLPKNIFKYSLQNIKTIKSLQKSILRRYKRSRPFLNKQEILTGGVAYSILKILKQP